MKITTYLLSTLSVCALIACIGAPVHASAGTDFGYAWGKAAQYKVASYCMFDRPNKAGTIEDCIVSEASKVQSYLDLNKPAEDALDMIFCMVTTSNDEWDKQRDCFPDETPDVESKCKTYDAAFFAESAARMEQWGIEAEMKSQRKLDDAMQSLISYMRLSERSNQ